MKYVKLSSDEAGESHFADVPMGAWLERDSATAKLVRVAPGHSSGLHPEASWTLATAVRGNVVITASDGQQRRLEPGTVMLFLDTAGRGHSFSNGPEEALLMIARLRDATPRVSPTGP